MSYHRVCCCGSKAAWRLTPCLATGSGCGICLSPKPAVFTVTVSGYDSPTLPIVNSVGGTYRSIQVDQISGLNGDHVAQFDSNVYDFQGKLTGCLYKADIATCRVRAWSGVDGTGTLLASDDTVTISMELNVRRNGTSGSYTLTYRLNILAYPSATPGTLDQISFTGQTFSVTEYIPSYDCLLPGTFSWPTGGSGDDYFDDLPPQYLRFEYPHYGSFGVAAGDPNSSCPGGGPIYTDTDCSAVEDRVILVEGVYYLVEANPDDAESDGEITVPATSYASCDEVCV